MAKSPAEMKASMIAGLSEKTGKTLEQWLRLVKSSGLTKHKEITTLLKTDHGLTHGFANMIALQALGNDSQTSDDTQGLVDSQYAAGKAALRPIYEAILKAIAAFGADVEVSPKKSYVSLRRKKQFALVQPTTATRVDVGLIIPAVKAGKRLEASGSFNAMMTHRVRLEKLADVDAELIGWLKQAYQAA
jgi:hypothetical protein